MGNLSEREHTGKQLTDFHGGRTHQCGTSCIAHFLNLCYHGIIFLALGLVDAVVHILTNDRAVGRNLYHIQLVDIPELTGLGDSCTRHTCQFMIHSEIVLQGDGGKSLCGGLHLHVLLGLHGLMQAITPAASFHDTAGLFVHNLDLTIHNDVFLIEIEHGISLQQLLDGVNSLALDGIVRIELIFLLYALLIGKGGVALEGRHL